MILHGITNNSFRVDCVGANVAILTFAYTRVSTDTYDAVLHKLCYISHA